MPGRLIRKEDVSGYLEKQAEREQAANQKKPSTADTVASWVRDKERPKAVSPRETFRGLFKKSDKPEEE